MLFDSANILHYTLYGVTKDEFVAHLLDLQYRLVCYGNVTFCSVGACFLRRRSFACSDYCILSLLITLAQPFFSSRQILDDPFVQNLLMGSAVKNWSLFNNIITDICVLYF